MNNETITIRTDELAGYQNTIEHGKNEIARLKQELQAERERADKAEALLTTTTDDASHRAAPTAAPAAAGLAETPPAEAGRQRYIIRQCRLDAITGEPTFIEETASEYLESIYGDTSPGNRVIVRSPRGEPNTLEVYDCRTPMHVIAMLAVLYCVEDDKLLKIEQEPMQVLSRYQREQQGGEQS